ncbi:MAG: T9SS type A sorting domain-containing protein [Bacteroidia bacterium]|nr:T9SS type A sorting domain-containing protein [Bacteroidia bacterium]
MKKHLLAIIFSSAVAVCLAQPATDFTTDDCGGNTHNLFAELNSGKVIVLNWVMPCSSCITASVSSYNIVQGYASSNPGQVLHYLIDDNGGTTCATLISWANTYGIGPNTTIFRNSGSAINEANYGGSGMPHIAVIGPDHTIYFNGLNTAANNPTAITNAINQALLVATGIQQVVNNSFNLSVAVTGKSVKVNYTLAESTNVTINIINALGQSVITKATDKQQTGNHNTEFDLGTMADGIYFLRLATESNSQTIRFSFTK